MWSLLFPIYLLLPDFSEGHSKAFSYPFGSHPALPEQEMALCPPWTTAILTPLTVTLQARPMTWEAELCVEAPSHHLPSLHAPYREVAGPA